MFLAQQNKGKKKGKTSFNVTQGPELYHLVSYRL